MQNNQQKRFHENGDWQGKQIFSQKLQESSQIFALKSFSKISQGFKRNFHALEVDDVLSPVFCPLFLQLHF